MSPVPWIALFTGLLSIPYFMSDDTPSPVARVDRPGRLPPQALPFRQLRPPGLPFVRNQQLRRDETNVPRQNQPFDQEFLEYKKKYAQWYNQWYLKHKEYYDKNFPFNTQAQGQIRPPPAGPAQRPPLRPANGPPPNPRPPPQRRRKPVQGQNPNRPPPQSRVPAKRRRVRPVRPIPPGAGIPRPALPQGQGARNAAQSSSISAIAEPHPNDFGTFPKEDNHGDSHFRVFRGPDVSTSTTTAPPTPKVVPKVPSPQPVYIPTTKAPPTTETGFKPIIKPDAPVADNTGVVRSQTVSESVQTPKQVKPNFRPPKQDDLLEKTKPVAVPKKPGTPPTNVQLAPGGFKPIPGLANVSPPRIEPETSTRKVSVITSSIFKTAPTTQTPPKTPAAVFFRTATEKSVRVVTSSSFVTQPTVPLPQKQALKDIRPQRHQESQSLDVSASLQAEESRPTVVIEAVPAGPQFLRSREEAPAGAPEPSVRSRGAVRTNVPAHIRVVDHLDHRPPQGFGLGPKPGDESEPLVSATTTPTATTPAPSPSTPTTVPIFALDSFYGSRLSRIDVIFHQLKVEGEGCREQVVCNIYKNPEVYTPFSDFLSRQLTVTLEELRRPKVSDERILRFFRYLKAARDGQDGVDCLARYPKCGQDTTSLSHKPIITTYQKVSRLMDASSSS